MKEMGDREGFRRRHGQRYFRAVHLITIFIGLQIGFPRGFAQNVPVPRSRGGVQGQITVAGSAEPIPNARITLSGGPFDPRALEVLMFPGAAISGQIRDTSGRPVAGAVVDAFRITYSNGLPVLQSMISMPTDDKGDYRLVWLPPGEYMLSVAPGQPANTSVTTEQQVRTFYPGFTEVSSAVPIVVRIGERVESISFAIRPLHPSRYPAESIARFLSPRETES
jgi:hypothetical protein